MIPLLFAFGVAVIVLIVVMIYRTTLENHEENQIFLDSAMQAMANEQSALTMRIAKVNRLIRALYILSGALAIAVAALWLWQMAKTF